MGGKLGIDVPSPHDISRGAFMSIPCIWTETRPSENTKLCALRRHRQGIEVSAHICWEDALDSLHFLPSLHLRGSSVSFECYISKNFLKIAALCFTSTYMEVGNQKLHVGLDTVETLFINLISSPPCLMFS